MLRRITDLWPNLLLRGPIGPEQAENQEQEPQRLTDLVTNDIETTFASLSWSRVVSLQVQ